MNNQQKVAGTWLYVNKLEEQMAEIREKTAKLATEINMILLRNYGNSSDYFKLKEQYDQNAKEIQSLNTQFEQMKIEAITNTEQIARELERNVKRAEELGRKKIQELEQQIDDRRKEHKLKDEQLRMELEMTVAASALEQDEMETSLRRQLVDLNTKIRRQKKINNHLKCQLEDLKNRKHANDNNEESILNAFKLNEIDELFENDIKEIAASQNSRNSKEKSDLHIIATNIPIMVESNETNKSNKNDVNESFNRDQAQGLQPDKLVKNKAVKTSKIKDFKQIIKWEIAMQTEKNVFKKKKICHMYQSFNRKVQSPFKSKTDCKKRVEKQTGVHDDVVVETRAPKIKKLYNPDDLDYLDEIWSQNNDEH
ncbi:hypothetical protein ABEB36_005389 [Hypothenemus hampei]|uniref:Uncharacterized protein n=1 Tax=Hypothenemus hampei TaxID=57062 RepID=A0ABD1EY30_HYPHA